MSSSRQMANQPGKRNVFELKSSASKDYEPLREDTYDDKDNQQQQQQNLGKQMIEECIDSKSTSSEYPTTVTTSFNGDDDDHHQAELDLEHDMHPSEKSSSSRTSNRSGASSAVQSVSSRRISRKLCQLMGSNHDEDLDDSQSNESGSSVGRPLRGQLNNNNNNNSHRPTGTIHRTISRSMLELDGHLNGSATTRNFEVVWSKLSFSYEPSWYQKPFSSRWSSSSAAAPDKGQYQKGGVLNNISGRFRSNQLVAIIGPSGCGKTTLLQFLAGNNQSGRHKMRIHGLDQPKVAFIGQDDGLLPGLTAQETLLYASRLQHQSQRRSGAPFSHHDHIQPILSELGLLECARRSVIKLSGGQAKRVTIAQELLYPTNLLILDEVTSGLDASTSYSIVKLLKYLVSDTEYPMSIVMSIHQPSAKLFSVFDQVYVMSEGCCLYEGSCQVDVINEHLSRFGLACPKYHNIADYLIELACDESLDDIRQQMIQHHDKTSEQAPIMVMNHNNCLSDGKQQQVERQDTQAPPRQDAQSLLNIPPMDFSLYEAIERARMVRQRPFLDHFVIHFSRSLLRIRRSYILTYLQLVTYILLGLQLATFYGPQIGVLSGCPRLPGSLMSYILTSNYADSSSSSNGGGGGGGNTEDDEELTQEMRRIQENMNFLLVSVMTATFAALEITVITFPMEAKTVKREWRNGWYRVSSYFMGRTLADLPFQLAFVVIFCLIIYILTGQIGLHTWRFVSFVSIIVMVALIAQSFGFIFGALFMDNLPAAVFTAPLCIFPTLLFSGFFSRVSQIPALYRPLTYLSHFRYAFDGLLVSLYGFHRCDCDQDQLDRYYNNSRGQAQSMKDMFRYLFGSNECQPSQGALDGSADDSSATSGGLTDNDNNLISHEDLAAIQANKSVAQAMAEANKQQSLAAAAAAATSATPSASVALDLARRVNLSDVITVDKTVEDSLVDSLFEHMLGFSPNANSTTHISSTTTPMPSAAASITTTTTTTTSNNNNDVMDHLADKFTNRMTQMLNKQSNFGHPLPSQCDQFNSYLMTEFDLKNNDLIFGLAMLLLMVLITRIVCNIILNFTIATRAR